CAHSSTGWYFDVW
nr:immunoglobulin heavy chain junction region [Mus musculus]NSM03915.1 immunoglobulin heavy chain junction region [Mus musculus]NSM04248.1 immunoglobulin heavy chain junction region [Mus musculus]NSM04619.1 immunoglobulin heavy chain junction region [Mus musculus]NSM05029.1 immunoglobulin heavy chain junction region [Mus musculus]